MQADLSHHAQGPAGLSIAQLATSIPELIEHIATFLPTKADQARAMRANRLWFKTVQQLLYKDIVINCSRRNPLFRHEQ